MMQRLFHGRGEEGDEIKKERKKRIERTESRRWNWVRIRG